jgi:hypothetical protein
MDSPHNSVFRSIRPANGHRAPGRPTDGTAWQAARLLDDKALDDAVDARCIVGSPSPNGPTDTPPLRPGGRRDPRVALAPGHLAAPAPRRLGLITVVFHLGCPLTDLEDWARRRAGEPGLQAASSTTTWPESCIPSGTAAWCGCSPPSLSGCCGSARRSGGTAVAPSLALKQADSPSGARRHGRGRPDGPDQSVTRMP